MNGKPLSFNVTHNSFEVRWNRPTFALPSSYILYVRNVTTHEVRECTTSGRECSMRVTNLSPNAKFVVSVCACIDTYTGPIGDESDVITTKKLAFKMKSSSALLQNTQATQNSLPTYAVKYEVEENDAKKIRRIIIGMVFICSIFIHDYKLLYLHFSHSSTCITYDALNEFN